MWLIAFLVPWCCAAASAVPVSIREVGFSDQYKSENTLGEYTFGYNEDHTTGGSFRREISDRLGNKFGSYGLRIGDGRFRIVNYVADQNGFRADVFSNEPGVESQNSNQFSKITKKGIIGVLVPGFRYSSIAPHVTFQRKFQTGSSFSDYGIVEDGGVVTSNYAAERDRPSVLPDGNFVPQLDIKSRYEDIDALRDDSYLDGGYSHESGTIAPNGTNSDRMEQQASDEESDEIQKQDVLHPASTYPSEQVDDHKNQHGHERATTFDDLNSFQSSIAPRKERVSSSDKNAILYQVADGTSANATTSTLPEA